MVKVTCFNVFKDGDRYSGTFPTLKDAFRFALGLEDAHVCENFRIDFDGMWRSASDECV